MAFFSSPFSLNALRVNAGLSRRAALALGLSLTASACFAQANAWPQRPIKLIVAFPAGGPTDTTARIVGQKLGERLGQPVVVENRPGASGSIGTAAFVKMPADGYAFSMLGMPALIAPHLYRKVAYDVAKDFLPVATVYDLPMAIVVNPQVLPEVKDLASLITRARADKGRMNYTSSGTGSFGHLSTELLKDLGHFDMQHVPYRGSAPAVTDLIGGQVPMMFADIVAAVPHIQSGKLRAIAVSSPQRTELLPGVRTIAEQGFPGFEAVTWGGLIAPVGTPKAILDRINQELKLILADKDVQKQLLAAGAVGAYQPAEAMAARLKADYARWGKVAHDKGISAE